MTRTPNEYEWRQLSARFPGLVWRDVVITDEPTRDYNCIGYSMGRRKWINPRSPQARFERQYVKKGFVVVADPDQATVDGWGMKDDEGNNDGDRMTHGSRLSSTLPDTDLWESKLGRWFRVTHGRHQLTGTRYGSVLTHFRREATEPEWSEEVSMPQYSDDELARIADQVAQVDAGLEAAFQERLTAWRATWDQGDLVISDNTYDFATGPEFEAMVGLGDRIVPLIQQEIANGEFFLIPLLEEFAEPVPPQTPVESEQSRGQRAVRAWLASL